jgi:hypothetical protein
VGTTAVSLRQNERSFGHIAEQTAGSGAAVIPITVPNPRVYKVLIQVLDFPISLRDDGGVASATTGLVIAAGDIYVLQADASVMNSVSVIGIGGTARIRLAYYGS